MRGFTVMELLVVTAIIAVVSTVLVVGQGAFSRNILLTTTTADVALSLRNAQTYGISSRGSGSLKKVDYGVHFTLGSSFVFFADTYPPLAANAKPNAKPGLGFYCHAIAGNCLGVDTLVQTLALNNGMTVTKFCARASSTNRCSDDGTPITGLSITFGRPNTSAVFTANRPSGATDPNIVTGVGANLFTSACIVVSSPQGTTRAIKVSQYGEIVSNKNTTCP